MARHPPRSASSASASASAALSLCCVLCLLLRCEAAAAAPPAAAARLGRGAALARDGRGRIASAFGSPLAGRARDAAAWAAGLPAGAAFAEGAALRLKGKLRAVLAAGLRATGGGGAGGVAGADAARTLRVGVLGGSAAAGRDVVAWEAFGPRLARLLAPPLAAAGARVEVVVGAAAWAAPLQTTSMCMGAMLGLGEGATPSEGEDQQSNSQHVNGDDLFFNTTTATAGTQRLDVVLLSLDAGGASWDIDVEGVRRARGGEAYATAHLTPHSGVLEALVRAAAALPGAPAVALVHADDTPPPKAPVRWDSAANPYGAKTKSQACRHQAEATGAPLHACYSPKNGAAECPALGACDQRCFLFAEVEGAGEANRRACSKSAEGGLPEGAAVPGSTSEPDDYPPASDAGFPRCALPHERALLTAYAGTSAALHEFSLLPVIGALFYEWEFGSFSFESLMVNAKTGPNREVYYAGDPWNPAPFGHDLKAFVMGDAYLNLIAEAMDELADEVASSGQEPDADKLRAAADRQAAGGSPMPAPRCAPLLCASRRPTCLLAALPHAPQASLRHALRGASSHAAGGGEGLMGNASVVGWSHEVLPAAAAFYNAARVSRLQYTDTPVVFRATAAGKPLRLVLRPRAEHGAPIVVCAPAGTPLSADDVRVRLGGQTMIAASAAEAVEAFGPGWVGGGHPMASPADACVVMYAPPLFAGHYAQQNEEATYDVDLQIEATRTGVVIAQVVAF